MKCRNPFTQGMHAYSCGQCMPCRIKRRSMWTHRIMLEALQWQDNSFWTLTYSDKNLPRTMNGLSTLSSEDARNFMKRIRAHVAPLRIRFYLVGEYGDETWRPHYHVGLFNYPRCQNGWRQPCSCGPCCVVRDTWGLGNIEGGNLETASAQYLAGYVTKKMTRNDDPRLRGRDPEFSRMSRRPGIGATAMDEVASTLMMLGLEESEADVPSALRHGSRLMPLGRYLKQQLRLKVGRDVKAPYAAMEAAQAEMLDVFLRARADKKNPSFKAHLVEAGNQEVLNLLSRQSIFKQRKRL